ncbi:ANTAR domain-containing protein [Klenkia marina]|uniref:ANTAR domain-containing protein n=1 Tax=Klenkia marina TaxID=1960309 RepID=A0A1G4XW96_9ACTN|nr:hypothetical protein [Klenkia marina]SCX44878.1 ANTAR domain-containing protein [Klenkia marina]
MDDAAGRFAAALTALELGSPDPALLPERLARACAAALPVDGAGLTCTFSADRRLPIGSSDAEAAAAERLQFTVGEGPCLTAHVEQRTVATAGDEMAARWPVYAAELALRTRYRGVVSAPVPGALSRTAAVNVFLRRAEDVAAVDEADLLAVAAAMGAALGDDLAGSAGRPLGMPAWLDGEPVADRQQVWRAVGFLVGRDGGSAGAAIARLRARAFTLGRDLESVAAAVLAGEEPSAPSSGR